MSARMQVPLSQRRHTNVAVVRYSKNGVKLEIACYKNKVISYRSGTETRLDEVLQVERVFTNVARGLVASEKDIKTAFDDDTSEQDAIKFMLEHGELQVAQHERTAEVDEMFKDIALIISQKCINQKTQRPFPSQVIEQALRSIGAGVKLDQPVKKQALILMRLLIESQVIPIERAKMKLRCTTRTSAGAAALERWCADNEAEIVSKVAGKDDAGAEDGRWSLLVVVPPNLMRELEKYVKERMPAGSTIHVVETAVMGGGEGEVTVDAAMIEAANAGDAAALPVSAYLAAEGSSTTDQASSNAVDAGARGRKPNASRAAQQGLRTDESEEEEGDDNKDGTSGEGGPGSSTSPKGGRAHGAEKEKRNKKKKNKAGKSRGGYRGDSSADDDSDGEEEEAEGTRRRGGGETGPTKQGKRKGKKTTNATSDDEDDEGEPQLPAEAMAAVDEDLAVQLQKLGLDPQKELGRADSDDDDHRKGGGGKGKKNKRKKPTPKAAGAAKKAAAVSDEEEENSDAELEVNRRQRKKQQAVAVKKTEQDFGYDEEDFDYGEDEEVEEA